MSLAGSHPGRTTRLRPWLVKGNALAEAREQAIDHRRQIGRGIDPIADKRRAKVVVPTFKDAALQVHAEQKARWKNSKHQVQWKTTLATYAFPFFGDRLVNAVEGPDIRKALLPIWLNKPETVRRVCQRVSAVLD